MKKPFIIIFILFSFKLTGQDFSYYEQAYQEIQSMLTGEQDISFKRAVFLSENAFFDNDLDFNAFQEQIDHLKRLSQNLSFDDGFSYQGKDREKVLQYFSAYTVMKDTVRFKIEKDNQTHYFQTQPFTYDFDDFFGETDWTKMFVTKLLATHQGNCHSLPYLYKILIEDIGGEAHLAMSPNHTYIKQWSEETGWYNTELTSGQFPLDAWIMASGYVNLEAIKNRVYMDALDQQQSISVILVDLAQGYQKRFGELADLDFVLNCLNTALDYYPNYAHARILKAETLKAQFSRQMDKFGITDHNEHLLMPDGKLLFDQMQEEYQSLHRLGYRKMPSEMYLNWLMDVSPDQINNEVQKHSFQASQPFSKFGYDVPVATLSQGKYQESFDQDTLIQIGSVIMNSLTGQITHFIEYDTVYSEATLEPEVISRWLSPDPKADERDWLSPYNFVQNNPILRTDPDGQLDEYFDADGNYLGSDDAETDEIRIIDPDVWLALGGSNTPDHETGNKMSTALTDTKLEEGAVVKIVSHYNDQLDEKSKGKNVEIRAGDLEDEKLLATQGRTSGFGVGPIMFKKPKDFIQINMINGEKVHKEMGTATNIKNTLVHENKHAKDRGKRMTRARSELSAIKAQRNHPTFINTTDSYKLLIQDYEDYYKSKDRR